MASDSGLVSVPVQLVFTAAFETVDHSILRQRMSLGSGVIDFLAMVIYESRGNGAVSESSGFFPRLKFGNLKCELFVKFSYVWYSSLSHRLEAHIAILDCRTPSVHHLSSRLQITTIVYDDVRPS